MRLKRPKAKRKACAVCGRTRLRRFIEWNPGGQQWQCSPPWDSCDAVAERKSQAAYYRDLWGRKKQKANPKAGQKGK